MKNNVFTLTAVLGFSLVLATGGLSLFGELDPVSITFSKHVFMAGTVFSFLGWVGNEWLG